MARCIKCGKKLDECKCSFRVKYKGKPSKAPQKKTTSKATQKTE